MDSGRLLVGNMGNLRVGRQSIDAPSGIGNPVGMEYLKRLYVAVCDVSLSFLKPDRRYNFKSKQKEQKPN